MRVAHQLQTDPAESFVSKTKAACIDTRLASTGKPGKCKPGIDSANVVSQHVYMTEQVSLVDMFL